MIPFEEIDAKLDKLGKDRKWLSEASGRKPDSIRVALAPNADPKNRTGLLQKALSDAIVREEEAQAAMQEPPQPGFHNIFLDDAQLDRADRASRQISAASLVDFCRDAIVFRADELLAGRPDPMRRNMPAPKLLPDPPAKAHILAAAGSPISAEVTDWDGADDTVMVRISGLSMAPLLNDGDVIAMKHKIASRNPFMKKGLIYLVEYDGGYTVKRYNTRPARAEEKGEEWVEKGKVKVLESINPNSPEIIIKQPVEWVAWLDAK